MIQVLVVRTLLRLFALEDGQYFEGTAKEDNRLYSGNEGSEGNAHPWARFGGKSPAASMEAGSGHTSLTTWFMKSHTLSAHRLSIISTQSMIITNKNEVDRMSNITIDAGGAPHSVSRRGKEFLRLTRALLRHD